MKKISQITSVILAIVLLCSCLLSCSSSSKDDKFYNENDPIQVVDGAGRHVSFPEPAKTVATSWGGSIDSYFFALGVVDRIAATNSHGYFEKVFFDPDNMKKVGRFSLDKEALADLSPDLYLHGYYNTEYIEGANKVGVRAYGMGFNSFDDIEKNLTDLGVIFGIEDRANFVCDYCNKIKELVVSRVATVPEAERPSVVVLGEKTGELASDIYDTIEEMISYAGGISCTPDDLKTKTETTVVGLETIFGWNPDFVFLKDYYCDLTVDDIMKDSTWQAMNAVKNQHVFALPSAMDGWCAANPSCYLGTLYMSMMMYPELYEDIDFEETVLDFYHNVYNIDLTVEEIGLDGQPKD